SQAPAPRSSLRPSSLWQYDYKDKTDCRDERIASSLGAKHYLRGWPDEEAKGRDQEAPTLCGDTPRPHEIRRKAGRRGGDRFSGSFLRDRFRLLPPDFLRCLLSRALQRVQRWRCAARGAGESDRNEVRSPGARSYSDLFSSSATGKRSSRRAGADSPPAERSPGDECC